MKKILFTTLAIVLVMFVCSGLALAKKAPPPFQYGFVDMNGNGVFDEGVDVAAVVDESKDVGYLSISVPESVTGGTLVIPDKTHISIAKESLYIDGFGVDVVQIGAAVSIHAHDMYIFGKGGLTVGKGVKLITEPDWGDIIIEMGGNIDLNDATLISNEIDIYSGVSWGDDTHGAFSAKGLSMKVTNLNIATKQGITLTDSAIRFMKNTWEPSAFIWTNFSWDGTHENLQPVDLSNTRCTGPGKADCEKGKPCREENYYFVDVYGSPAKIDGMVWKGNYDFYLNGQLVD